MVDYLDVNKKSCQLSGCRRLVSYLDVNKSRQLSGCEQKVQTVIWMSTSSLSEE